MDRRFVGLEMGSHIIDVHTIAQNAKTSCYTFSATILQQTIRFSNRIQSTVRSPSNVRVREAKWKEKPKQSIESSHSKQWMQWNVK